MLGEMQEGKLLAQQNGLFDAIINRYENGELWRFYINLTFVVGGGLLSAIGKLGGLGSPSDTWITAIGLLMVFAGGLLVAIFDRKRTDLTRQAKDGLELAQAFLKERDGLQDDLATLKSAAVKTDAKRRSRLKAIEEMVVVLEAALLQKSDDLTTADSMLDRAMGSINGAIDYDSQEILSISIYRRQGADKSLRLARLTKKSTHAAREAEGKIFCGLSDGFSGHAWARAESAQSSSAGEVILSDTSHPNVRTQFPVSGTNAELENRQKSVAAIPVLIKPNNEVWGVVFAAISRVGVFDPNEVESGESQNVGMIRDVARMVALLAALKRAPDIKG
jgi:hypothetical protein